MYRLFFYRLPCNYFHEVRINLLSSSPMEILTTTGRPWGQTYGIDVAKSWSINTLISTSESLSPALMAALHEKDFATLSRESSFTCVDCS